MVFSIVDVAMIERHRVRALPKTAWIVIVVILPVVGPLLWLTLGREGRGTASGSRAVAPDDDPAFLGGLQADARLDQDERIRRLEQELAELDDEQPRDH